MGVPRYRRLKQWGRYNTKYFWRLHFQDRAKLTFPDQPLPAVIKDRGIKVEDPNHPDFPRKRSLDPIELEHPAWPKAPSPESHPWYREVPGYVYTGSDPLAEGTNHALAISKGLLRQGLPDSILKAAEWLNLSASKEKIEQLIVHSQYWDSTIECLPKRRDPVIWWFVWPLYYGIPQGRKNELLLDNLFRFTQTEGIRNSYVEFKSRRYVRSAPINAVFDRNGKTFCVNVVPQVTISQPEGLTPLADSKAVDGTANEALFDIRPVTTFVDLKQTNIFNPDQVAPFSWSPQQQIVHTVLVNKVNDVFYPWSAHELTGHAVMAAFGAALSSAKLLFPDATGTLPKPITAQCIQCSGGTFEFVVFQLNSVNFKDDSGMKNIAYVDGGNKLFTPREHWKNNDKVDDYNPEVIRKFVALLSNGISIRK